MEEEIVKYFDDYCKELKKSVYNNGSKANTIIYTSLELIRKISILLYPVIPNSSLDALSIFNVKETNLTINSITNNEFLKPSMEINKINILFRKVLNND